MKENIALGSVVGLAVSAMSWEGHRFVEPHTFSVFPTRSMLLAVPAMILAAMAILARRRGITHPSVLSTQSSPFVMIASVIYGAGGVAIAYPRQPHAPLFQMVLTFVLTAVILLVMGEVTAFIGSRWITPRASATA